MQSVASDLPLAGSAKVIGKTFAWDVASRITAIADIADATLSASYAHDALDRLTGANNGASAWGYTFDGVGNRLTSSVNAASTTYAYAAGSHRLASLSGAQVKSYTFDAAGNMTSDGTATWTYGGHNRPTQVQVGSATTVFAINALGQRVRKATGSSATRFVLDEAGRLMGEYTDAGVLIAETIWLEDLPVAVLKAQQEIAQCFTAFAANERLEVRSGRVGAADWEWGLGANTQQAGSFASIASVNWASGVPIRFVLAYSGTGTGTLTLFNATTGAQLATVTYANATNPLRVGNALRLYVKSTAGIGAGNKIRARLTAINGAAQSIDLETAGNDAFSELAATAEVPGYQAQGMTVEGTVTLTFTGTAPPTGSRLNMTLSAGSAPCAGGGGGGGPTQLHYVHPDHLGTPRAITRPSDNALVWRWENAEPFGNSAPNENPSGLGTFAYNLRFPGQYFDSETGTHYNYFRDYDPGIGRYVQSDPIGLEGGLNTYAYVGGNPLSFIDFLGLASECGCSGSDPGPGSGGPLKNSAAGDRPSFDPKNPPKYSPPKGAPGVEVPPRPGKTPPITRQERCFQFYTWCRNLCIARCPGGWAGKGVCLFGCATLFVACNLGRGAGEE